VIRICRRLYCLGNRYRSRPVDSLAIAQRIAGPSCVSLEAALAFHGWLPEAVETVTSACDARSRQVQTPIGWFHFDRVPQLTLFAGVSRVSRADGQAAFIEDRAIREITLEVVLATLARTIPSARRRRSLRSSRPRRRPRRVRSFGSPGRCRSRSCLVARESFI